MSRFHVLLVNLALVVLTIVTSERVNRELDQIEKPIMFRVDDKISPLNRNVVPLIDSSSIFFSHLFKHKPQYQKLDKINPTAAPTVPVTGDCICVPFYQCDNNQTIITDGTGIIDVR